MVEMQQEVLIQFGKYEIFRKLALGGMAELYLAKQRGLGGFERTVVVKCILPQYSTDPQFLTMFLDEARIASQLNHPNIVQIYEIGEVHDLYYIAMEYVKGPNFKALRKALFHHYGHPALELIAGIMAQACAGLHHAHCATDYYGQPLAIVHRDVSPTNLLLTFEGTVKLVDFGVAKASIQEHQTVTGMVKGKYRYMSPEQILAQSIDHRSDVYSVGAVLYELTTGVVLFQRNSEAETIRAVYMDPVIPPSTVIEGYPPALERIVMKALERDVNLRYQTADEIRRDLEQYMYTSGTYFGPQQIAEALRDMFTHIFEPSLSGDVGSALTRNDYVRFGFLASPSSPMLANSRPSHTLQGYAGDSTPQPVSESSSPSSPSSFQGRSVFSPPSGQHAAALSGQRGATSGVSQPRAEGTPTRDIPRPHLAQTQTLPPFQSPARSDVLAQHEDILRDVDKTTDPIPLPTFPPPQVSVVAETAVDGDLEKRPSPTLWWIVAMLLAAGVVLAYWIVQPAHQPDPSVVQQPRSVQTTAPTVKRVVPVVPTPEDTDAGTVSSPDANQEGEEDKFQTPRNTETTGISKTRRTPVRTVPVRRRIYRPLRRVVVRRRVVSPRRTVPRVVERQPESGRNLALSPPRREEQDTSAVLGMLFVPAVPLAQVDIDGQLFGFTPINGKTIKPGRYRVRVSKEGFVTVERTIVVAPGQRFVLPIKLQPVRTVDVSDPTPPRITPSSEGPTPKLPFSAIRLSRSPQTLRIYIADQRGIGGNTYTYQFRDLCQQIEQETQRVLGSEFSTKNITSSLQKYVRQVATSLGQEQATFYPRAIAYIIYTQLARGRNKQRVAQLLLSYQKRKKFTQYRNQ